MAPGNKQIAKALEKQARDFLQHSVDGYLKDIDSNESLHNVSEQIGAQYGDRVLYELIQNAHDAHSPGGKGAEDKGPDGKGPGGKDAGGRGRRGKGKIAIKLVIRSDSDGDLYIANGGSGFGPKNVKAIKNVAISSKEVGEGIGNKGLGFRSIETLTDDVRIFSQQGMGKSGAKRFNGYCFGFSSKDEIEAELRSFEEIDAAARNEITRTMPRYMVPKYLDTQPAEVTAFAGQGYATVIVAPLKTVEAVNLAREQVKLLANLDVPLLLFLERIVKVEIDIQQFDQDPFSCCLKKRQKSLTSKISLATKKSPTTKSRLSRLLKGSTLHEVDVGGQCKFLVVRHEVDKNRVHDAVKKSIPSAPQLKNWLNWQGQPTVSVAVDLSDAAVTNARLYNFLPMGREAESPLTGYIDAPFFTDIDRRGLDLSLPLNETLLEVAAEVCADAALAIVKHGLPIKQQAVFDLFAWTGQYAYKLDAALIKYGSSLGDAQVIPAIADKAGNKWASISAVSVWPEGSFAVLKDREVAKHVGARLVSGEIDALRVERLNDIALYRAGRSLTPSGAQLADWSEAFAKSLLDRKSAMQTWSRFYNDLPELFSASNVGLDDLVDRWVLLDRSDRLKPAAGSRKSSDASDAVDARVYVRRDMPKGTRKKAGVPLPPVSLARRYRFLNERIELKPKTLDGFIKAGLLLEYDPIEALVGLKSALGTKATEKQRKEALVWAYHVWRAATERVDDELRVAELHVPTRSGWRLANHAVFSSSWTSVGQTLQAYLVASVETSADCKRARDLMLIEPREWPESVQSAMADWVSFLKLIGVEDGLRPVPGRIPREGSPANLWIGVLRNGESAEGLDEDWCAEVDHVSFRHRYTHDYVIRDQNEVWRFPGQIEHESLSDAAKEALCNLVFEHLKVYRTGYFHFEVGRFGRGDARQWDAQKLPTPLASFLRTKAWIAVTMRNEEDGMAFRRPNECWASRTRTGRVPIFMDRISEAVANISDDDALADVVFGEALGLRDWQSKDTAVDRVMELAGVATSLVSHEKPIARNAYRDAWENVVATGASLPSDIALMVKRRGQIEVLSGNTEAPPALLVTEDAQSPAVRILHDSGLPVLEVGKKLIEKIAALLESTGAFEPRRLNGEGVQLLVNGEPFEPRSSDGFLTSQELDWLPEFIDIANELRGEQLERGVRSATIDKRVRAIRLRRCESMNLMVDNEVLSSPDPLNWYAYPHDDLPTLIVTDDVEFDWKTLAGPLFDDVLRLVHGNLKTPRHLLAQVGLHRAPTDLSPPTDKELAGAFECDDRTVQEYRQARNANVEHILDLLVPVVAYHADVRLARRLRRNAEQQGDKFNLLEWLQRHMSEVDHSPKELMDACRYETNRSEVRKTLGLDYVKFNEALLKLGESPLSNEAELRHMYKAHLNEMHSNLAERLRRHYADDFRQKRDLVEYVERKSFTFLEFNSEWTLTRETLDEDVIEAHVSKLLDEVLGKDPLVELDPLDKVRAKNRKAVGEFVEQALSLLPTWCQKNGVPIPDLWSKSEGRAVERHLENRGLFDFYVIESKCFPFLCRRASCWPSGMPETLDPNSLGLGKGDIEKQHRQREKEKQERALSNRSITFAGRSLDTADPMFAKRFEEIAVEWLSKDADWFDRCRQKTRLTEFNKGGESKARVNGDPDGGEVPPPPVQPKLTDAHRRAMGLASEWLAFKFLSRRHSKFVNENSWVSANRFHFFGGSAGNDAAGYDFCVKTPKIYYMYEVKSSLEDSREFELTANELRVAGAASKDGRRRYRILYVPYVFSPDRWRVLELSNPMGEGTRDMFKIVGSGSVRYRFRPK